MEGVHDQVYRLRRVGGAPSAVNVCCGHHHEALLHHREFGGALALQTPAKRRTLQFACRSTLSRIRVPGPSRGFRTQCHAPSGPRGSGTGEVHSHPPEPGPKSYRTEGAEPWTRARGRLDRRGSRSRTALAANLGQHLRRMRPPAETDESLGAPRKKQCVRENVHGSTQGDSMTA